MNTVPLTQKTWFIAVMCLFCFPVGLIFLWMHPNWTKQTKWAVTGLIAFIFIVGSIYNNSPAGKAEQAKQAKEEAIQAQHQAAQDKIDAQSTREQKKRDDAANSASTDVKIGDDGYLTAGVNNVLVSADCDTAKELQSEIYAKDDIGIGKMMVAGRVFSVPDHTHAKLIDYGPGLLGAAYYRIRIVSGQHDTDDGWVIREWMKK